MEQSAMVSIIIFVMGKIDEHIPNLLAVQDSWKMPKKGGNNVDGGAPLSLCGTCDPKGESA